MPTGKWSQRLGSRIMRLIWLLREKPKAALRSGDASASKVRSTDPHPPKMLHRGRMAGLGKLLRSASHLAERPVWASTLSTVVRSVSSSSVSENSKAASIAALMTGVMSEWPASFRWIVSAL